MLGQVAPEVTETGISLPEITSALSFALDLTEGALPGHAVRSTLLGMRLAQAMKLPRETLAALYYALQLKDVGCSSNASRMAEILGGDDRRGKATAKVTDWTGVHRADARTVVRLWSTVLPNRTLRQRSRRMVALGLFRKRNNQEMITLRCERGAEILRMLDVGATAANAVYSLDEHWNGGGYPDGLAGTAIPLLARICSVAQTLDVFARTDGTAAALNVLRKRSGRWFDPEVVEIAKKLSVQGTLWKFCGPDYPVDVTRRAVIEACPDLAQALGTHQIDNICEAFANVVDAKSPFTYRHSLRVTETAVALAEALELGRERTSLVRRAALLHDLGKLGISNTILDKPSSLSPEEREQIAEHPLMTRSILERIAGFSRIAQVAAEHHERLDGSGYPFRLQGDQIGLESRLLAVADCFATLAEERPYRKALPIPEILTTLEALTPQRLDAGVVHALRSVVAAWGEVLPPVFQAA